LIVLDSLLLLATRWRRGDNSSLLLLNEAVA